MALEDRRHQQQEKLVANLFDQASHVYPFDSLTEHDMEGMSESLFVICSVREKKINLEREFVARRRWIAKGKQPEGRKDNNTV